ncbi:thiopurine S-methyltransferase [Xanthomonas fragariae]|uniref:Thiopurine S-methyltransferase n=1 Tax=Xanthomonas fragariae TaxID=48664 RepID=A0A1Y6GWV4_9XANT|nr:hypothetical protein BER92_06530 [Xanthomonas fragariae]ENZ94738.1 thiopurine S-methyltransferase [Xanthomonas fragariae LMG 25863]AOD17838.1 hypothetical protein BER93_06540 [Xanthomonas fragariae]SMQ94741.1 thiopurine S-methyltransferase [Xanthomonas fragariae]SMQ99878.1 hypothetical protein PD885_02648 [Xanthomonas fragariae]
MGWTCSNSDSPTRRALARLKPQSPQATAAPQAAFPRLQGGICGDTFALDASVLARCTALIAAPAELRRRYLETVVNITMRHAPHGIFLSPLPTKWSTPPASSL